MSYRFYPERVEPLGRKEGVVDTDLLIPIQGINGLRITIPSLRIQCGATAQVVSNLQVTKSFTVSNSAAIGKTVTLRGLDEDLTAALVAVDGGDDTWFFSSVSERASEVVTLADSENAVEAPAPGVFQAADLNYPIILHITNESNPVTVRGGVVVYINR